MAFCALIPPPKWAQKIKSSGVHFHSNSIRETLYCVQIKYKFSYLLPSRFLVLFTLFFLIGIALPSISFAAGDGPDGTTELDGSTAITTDQIGGLIESAATGAQTDTIDIDGTTNLVLGTEGSGNSDGITFNGSASALTQTINVTDSTPGTDTFTIAGDIELANGQGDSLTLNNCHNRPECYSDR